MALASGNGSLGSAKAKTRKLCLRRGGNNWTSLDLFGTLTKPTGRTASAICRCTRSAKVIVAFLRDIKKMVFDLGNGLVFNAATRIPYLHHADNNWTSFDLFGMHAKPLGRKASAI